MSTLGGNNVVSTLYQRFATLFQRRAPTLYQRCAILKIRRRILFHFQRRINVISTLIHNVETTLIRRWNVGKVFCSLLLLYAKAEGYRNILKLSCKLRHLESSFCSQDIWVFVMAFWSCWKNDLISEFLTSRPS